METSKERARALEALQGRLAACRQCPRMVGTPVHGPPVLSRVLLVGQAPGPREAAFGRPFAWTAGRTLFAWFQRALGVTEDEFRARVYMAAVARCFPGKAPGGGDRRPDPEEVGRCREWLLGEVALLTPKLVIPVGTLAIEQVFGVRAPLVETVGRLHRGQRYLGAVVDVIPLPHPSGASTWHRMKPGVELLERALGLLATHPQMRRALPRRAAASR